MMYSKEHLEILVRYFHPQRKYPFLRGAFSQAAHASLFGIREQLFSRIHESLILNMQESVDKKLEDSTFADKIKQLDFPKGSKIVALGDSLTDDLLSWFEMLRYAVTKVRPDDDIKFVNYATTGDTSSQLLQSVVEAHQLENIAQIFCLIGTNDSRCFGEGVEKTNVSLNEFIDNISTVTEYTKRKSAANWMWLLPVKVDLARIAADPFLQNLELSWQNQQIEDIQSYLREREEASIELQALVTDEMFHERDGLHWTLKAHAYVFEHVIEELIARQI